MGKKVERTLTLVFSSTFMLQMNVSRERRLDAPGQQSRGVVCTLGRAAVCSRSTPPGYREGQRGWEDAWREALRRVGSPLGRCQQENKGMRRRRGRWSGGAGSADDPQTAAGTTTEL